ncbi:MAG: VTT domain-containing protein [Chloroflexota bacterium]|nr:VTT domain-containing protein [Chloroflexota bacterium]
MEVLGLAGVVALLALKEAGVPIPVPGDLIVIGAGIAAARGDIDPLLALVAIVLATVVGGVFQLVLVRGRARPLLSRLMARVGIPVARVEEQAARLRRHGAKGVAVARMTPGVRVVAIGAAGLAALPFGPFAAGLLMGNAAFSGAHFLLGLVLGEPALRLVGTATVPVAAAAILFALVGAGAWVLLARRPRQGQSARGAWPDRGLLDWADAACPACLGVAVAGALTVDRQREAQ